MKRQETYVVREEEIIFDVDPVEQVEDYLQEREQADQVEQGYRN